MSTFARFDPPKVWQILFEIQTFFGLTGIQLKKKKSMGSWVLSWGACIFAKIHFSKVLGTFHVILKTMLKNKTFGASFEDALKHEVLQTV